MTRTAATFLVGVAVTAASGCLAADPGGSPAARQQSPAPQSPAAPPPRPAGQGGQPELLVEAPVHEVLEAAVLPSERVPEPRRSSAAPAKEQEPRRATPPEPHRAKAPDRHTAPEPAEPRHGKPHRKADKPPALPKIPATAADVCALGTGYGGWHPNSPEARICRDTYGG